MWQRTCVLIFLIVCTIGKGHCQSSSLLSLPYVPTQTRGSLGYYLHDISDKTGVTFSFSEELLVQYNNLSVTGHEQTIEATLRSLLNNTSITFVGRPDKILLIPPQHLPKVTISGFIKDSVSQELLIGAYVYIPTLQIGTATNQYGFYSLSVPIGKHELIYACIGYQADSAIIHVKQDLREDKLLSPGIPLAGVKVTTPLDYSGILTHLTNADMSAHAGLLGENDVFRALQHVSGVQSGAEGTSTALVRGGDPGQNLNIMDGVPLYYIDHFYGITSVFNTEAIKSVDFYKGAFPARYGGRLSSIIDVNTRDGNMERAGGSVSMGLLKGSMNLEGPIVKHRSSFLVSARRTWIDALWRPFLDGFKMDFYDINGKVNVIANKNNRVYASFYHGRDQFAFQVFGADMRAAWGNTIGSVRWTSVVSPQLFINTTASYSYFRYLLRDQDVTVAPDSLGNFPTYTGISTIADGSLRIQADYYPATSHHIQAGLLLSRTGFAPAATTYFSDVDNRPTNTISAAPFRAGEVMVYGEDDFRINHQFRLKIGLHWANWWSKSYGYSSLQPRLQLTWSYDSLGCWFVSATRMGKFLHLLQSNTSGFPADFWVPSTERIQPATSWLYSAGLTRKAGHVFDLKAEFYYKKLDKVLAYLGSSNIFSNSLRWQDKLIQGSGSSYGFELDGQYKAKFWSFQGCYTLSWTWRQFDQVNNGKAFPFRYDRRHNVKLNLILRPRKGIVSIIGWTYMSGEAITLPDQAYSNFNGNTLGIGYYPLTYNYSEPNNYRLPAIHRLDLSISFIRRKRIYYERAWTVGLFNAYGRHNIIGAELIETTPGQISLKGYSLFRYVPTISYSVKFQFLC